MRIPIDYLLVAVVAFTIISSSSSQIFINTTKREAVIKQQQLTATAERILDQMIFNTGQPANWGELSDLEGSELKSFGLALEDGNPYELDIDKILRCEDSSFVMNSNVSTIPSDSILSALGIKGVYGLSLSFSPAFKISISPTHNSSINNLEDRFLVEVRTHEDIPVPNVNMTGSYLTAYKTSDVSMYVNLFKNGVTDFMGRCSFDYTTEISSLENIQSLVGCFFIVQARVQGMKMVELYNCVGGGSTVYASIVGSSLYVSTTESIENQTGIHGQGAVHLYPAVFLLSSEAFETVRLGKTLPVTPLGSARPFVKFEIESLDEDTVLAAFLAKRQGKWNLVVATRTPQESGIIGYNPNKASGACTINLRRLVTVGGCTYYLDMYFWRIAE